MNANTSAPTFATLVQGFFLQRLIQQQNASAQTVAAYRDTFRLLLTYLQTRRKKQLAALTLADLDAAAVAGFLDYLEKQRGNSIRTRNARFAALRSFLKYATAQDPASLPIIQRVLAIPMKRLQRPALSYLSREEVAAILEAPAASTWSGRRDRVLLALLYNTGARVSEALGLRRLDVSLDATLHVQITGKGRKQRVVPLWQSTAQRCAHGWYSSIQIRIPLSSRTGVGDVSPDPGWKSGCAAPSPRPPRSARACGANGFRPIPFGTRRPCTCSSRVSISPSSPCGLVTKACRQRINMSKPIWS